MLRIRYNPGEDRETENGIDVRVLKSEGVSYDRYARIILLL